MLLFSGSWSGVQAHDPGFLFMGSDPGANTVTPAWIPPSDTAAVAKPLEDTPTPTFSKASPPVPTESVASTVVTDSVPTARAMDTLRAVVAPDTATLKDSADTAKILTANKSRDVLVVGVRPMTAFSRATFTDQDLSVRTQGGDPADVVKVAPGLFTGQHAGGGKANQYFIRGFDCDHGTDLAIWFDGMPVNEPSHAHGQGYADLHFIVPELVDRVQVDKGPYDIQYGDFATAAAISMTTRSKLDENEVYLYGGAFGTDRVVSMLALPGSPNSILATEYYQSDGPFVDPEKNRRFNVFFKNTLAQSANSHLSITLMGYGASWNASGQIPLRAVDSGWIPLYGSEDSSEGGNSQRFSAALNYVDRPDPQNTLRATAYLIDYSLSLFSDFTFYDVDSVDGDEINQRDDRVTAGFHSDYRHDYAFGGVPTATIFGLEARDDRIHSVLDHAEDRRIIGHYVDANVDETSLGEYAMQSVQPFRWLYAEAGLRGDHFGFDVVDNLHKEGDSSITGNRDAQMWSPKANVVLTPWAKTDIFLNYGQGFHSNDAKGVTSPTDPATPLTKAVGYEIGVRTKLWNRLDLASSLWRIDLHSEYVWDGDVGGTEFEGATRREGVDASIRWQILDWLWSDLDMTRNTSVYESDPGNSNSVALAPRFTATGGLSFRHPSGFYGGLRFQHLDDRPADPADSLHAAGFTVLDLNAGYRWNRWEVILNLGNLTDTRWYTAQFETTTRIKNPQGVLGPATTDMDVVPGPPINVKVGLKYYF